MMILMYIILFFCGVQFLSILLNLIFIQKLRFTEIKNNPLVSVLIPARNEEGNILKIISDIKNQSYQNIEILVYDDDSEDETAMLVENETKNDKRLRLLRSIVLPEGWLGKNNACHNLAINAKGDYLLFLDADVRIKKDLIQKTIAYAQRFRLGLLSIFPIQEMKTFGEKITVPIMNYILLTLLPLIFVRKSIFKAHSAANGQFMLFNSEVYKKYYPHRLFKSEKVEDIKISRFYKSNKIPTACITGSDLITCRMYKSYKEALNGFSKNIVMFLGNSYFMTFLFWIFSFFPIFIFIFYFDIFSFCIYIILLLSNIIFYSIVSRQNVFYNILLFYPQLINMLIITIKSLINKKTGKQKWKGRLV